MNGSLRRLRLVASVASMAVTVFYIVTQPDPEVATLLALIAWNLTCLGLYRWPERSDP